MPKAIAKLSYGPYISIMRPCDAEGRNKDCLVFHKNSITPTCAEVLEVAVVEKDPPPSLVSLYWQLVL